MGRCQEPAEHPPMNRTAPTTETFPAPKVNKTNAEKPSSSHAEQYFQLLENNMLSLIWALDISRSSCLEHPSQPFPLVKSSSFRAQLRCHLLQEALLWDFPGGPVARTPSARGRGLIPGQGTRSHKLQLRWKIPRAPAKTQCSQINK